MKENVYNLILEQCTLLVHDQIPHTVTTHLAMLKVVQESINTPTNASASRSSRRPWDSYSLLNEVDMDATLSIYLQQHKYAIKRDARTHKKRLASYLQRLRNGENIVALAKSVKFPRYMLLKYLIKDTNLLGDRRKKFVGTAGHDIEDPLIRRAVQEAAAADTYCSPAADLVRLNVGVEFELILQIKLQKLGIAFQSEDQMRDEGRSKTPDIRLIVPIAVFKPNQKPHVVNWIDSKAMFGDPHTHEENQNQLQGYVNRYGPGMVIYWFDFVEELNDTEELNDVLICRDLPIDFVGAST